MNLKQKEKYQVLIDYFSAEMPNPETELIYDNDYQLLVAVILSAQCTDKRINLVTPKLFDNFPNTKTLSQASQEEVFELIRSVSYPNNKAKHLIQMAQRVESVFEGQIPSTVEDLVTLSGVGRKTANVITSVLYEQPNMAVDTHVYRLSHRLGLVKKTARTPLLVEKELIRHFPQELIHKAHHWLILHGRYVCKAKNPNCNACGLKTNCQYFKTI